MNNWIKVFGSNQIIEAEMAKTLLIDHSIQAVIINKIDSAYNNFGQAEVYCNPDDFLEAQNLINKYFKDE